jgi:hypothetical protein
MTKKQSDNNIFLTTSGLARFLVPVQTFYADYVEIQ